MDARNLLFAGRPSSDQGKKRAANNHVVAEDDGTFASHIHWYEISFTERDAKNFVGVSSDLIPVMCLHRKSWRPPV